MRPASIGIQTPFQNYGETDMRNRRHYPINETTKIIKRYVPVNHTECKCRISNGEFTRACHFSAHLNQSSKIMFPALIALYLNHHSPLPMLITLYSFLALYSLELCGFCDSLLIVNWIASWGISMSLIYEHYRWNDGCVWGFMTCVFDVSLIGCLGCMNMLRYTDVRIHKIQIQKVLNAILPVSSSTVVTHVLSSNLELEKIISYILLFLLLCSTNLIRSTDSSFYEGVPSNYTVQSTILLFLPGVMYAYSGFSWDFDSFADLGLIFSLSFVLQFDSLELFCNARRVCKAPTKNIYQLCLGIFIATVAFCYEFFLPFTQDVKNFMAAEEEQEPILVTCIFFSLGVFTLLLSFHLKNKRKDSGQLFFGKNHDEMILALVIISVLMFACVLSLPLELLFLISTSVFSLFVFVGTKMVRCLLASLCLGGVGLNTLFDFYKFRFFRAKVWLVPKIVDLDFVRFNQVLIGQGIIALLTYGFAASFSRNKFAIRKLMLGICLVIYSIILPFSEASMHFLQVEVGSSSMSNSSYSGKLMILTSITCILVTIILQHYHLVSEMVLPIVSSVSLSKLVALYIVEVPFVVDSTAMHSFFIKNFSKTSLLFILNIVIFSFSSCTTKEDKDKMVLKAGRLDIVKIYIFYIYPAVLIYSTHSIVYPFIRKLSGFEDYHSHRPQMIVKLADAISFWGLSVFIVIQALCPDDSSFLRTKQISCAFFLFCSTMLVINVEQTTETVVHSNPYLSISNDSTTGRPLTGFWLVVAAGLVVLHLFIVSSLFSFYHQTSHFIAMYGVLFSVAISFFSTMQVADKSESITLSLVCNALISCTHTITTVYSTVEKATDFSKSVQAAKIAHVVSFSALCIALVSGSIMSVGSIFCIFSFSLSFAIKMRKERSTKTKSLGNISSILSWLTVIAISYKQYGLLSFMPKIERFVAIPTSLAMTLLASFLLLTTETEERMWRSNKSFRQWNISGFYGLTIPSTTYVVSSCATAVFLTMTVLIVVSIYVVLFRGISGSPVPYAELLRTNPSFGTKASNPLSLNVFAFNEMNLSRHARLAASSIWTSENIWFPLRHLIGIIMAPLPIWHFCSRLVIQGGNPKMNAIYYVPLHIFPLTVCNGIPSLTALTIISFFVSIFLAHSEYKFSRKISMAL